MDTVKVMISLPKPLLEVVDRTAAEEHRSRSELLREAMRRYLDERDARRRPIDDPRVREAVIGIAALSRADQPTPGWDTVEAVRRTRQQRHA
jgi:metal-responsive CopG/Arc/MetJ family transcriptional regulator